MTLRDGLVEMKTQHDNKWQVELSSGKHTHSYETSDVVRPVSPRAEENKNSQCPLCTTARWPASFLSLMAV